MTERHADLMRQGFMRPLKATKAPKAEKPIVACEACFNWHREGKHMLSASERKANLAKLKCNGDNQ